MSIQKKLAKSMAWNIQPLELFLPMMKSQIHTTLSAKWKHSRSLPNGVITIKGGNKMLTIAKNYPQLRRIINDLVKDRYTLCDTTDRYIIYEKTICGITSCVRIKPVFWDIYKEVSK